MTKAGHAEQYQDNYSRYVSITDGCDMLLVDSLYSETNKYVNDLVSVIRRTSGMVWPDVMISATFKGKRDIQNTTQ